MKRFSSMRIVGPNWTSGVWFDKNGRVIHGTQRTKFMKGQTVLGVQKICADRGWRTAYWPNHVPKVW